MTAIIAVALSVVHALPLDVHGFKVLERDSGPGITTG